MDAAGRIVRASGSGSWDPMHRRPSGCAPRGCRAGRGPGPPRDRSPRGRSVEGPAVHEHAIRSNMSRSSSSSNPTLHSTVPRSVRCRSGRSTGPEPSASRLDRSRAGSAIGSSSRSGQRRARWRAADRRDGGRWPPRPGCSARSGRSPVGPPSRGPRTGARRAVTPAPRGRPIGARGTEGRPPVLPLSADAERRATGDEEHEARGAHE